MSTKSHRFIIAIVSAFVLMLTLTVAAPHVAQAQATGCSVSYTVPNQWQGGFTGNVTVTNLGSPVSGWRLTWSYTAGQLVVQGWNAVFTAAGPQVEAGNETWNGNLGTGASVSFGFNGSWNNQSNPAPTSFALNGTVCTGGTSTPPPATSPPPTSPPPQQGGSLPTSFQWRSTGPLIAPRPDATHNIRAVKDPTVVFHNGRYHVFVSTTDQGGNYNMAYLNFTDWSQAGAAPHHYLDQRIGAGYRAAPHVFFFAPRQRWYLVYQTGDNAAYSTTTDISNPQSWTTPQFLYPGGMPQIIRDNMGGTWWVDFWVICDSAMCYMFSSDGNGHLYRSETTVGEFPNGFRNTVIAMQDPNRFPLWEAVNVYKVQGANQYLLIVEAANGRRWFRSWTAPAITGPWTPLADTEANPFARANNVTFDGTAWTQDISHGEMIRNGIDQTLTIDPCNIRYAYQGVDPGATDSYNFLPWRLGLLTQTNSTC